MAKLPLVAVVAIVAGAVLKTKMSEYQKELIFERKQIATADDPELDKKITKINENIIIQ